MKKYQRIFAWTLVLILVVAVTASCAKKEPPAKPRPEPVEFVLPETRIVANDLLADSLFYETEKSQSADRNSVIAVNSKIERRFGFSASISTEEIMAPIAIVMRESKRSKDWFFAKTDIIDTVQDLKKAKSVLYVVVYEPYSSQSTNETYPTRYHVYFADTEFRARYEAWTEPDDENSKIIIEVPERDDNPGIAQADEDFFTELSKLFSISQNASTDVSGILHFLQDIEVDQSEIVDAVKNYSYPENERLSNNTGALKQYKSYVYTNIRKISENKNHEDFSRDPEIFDNINQGFELGSNKASYYSETAQGDPYLIVFYERTGVEDLGNYLPALFSYMFRATVVDAFTKQVVAWEEDCFSFKGDPPEYVSQFKADEHGRNIYRDGLNPPDLISPYLPV